MSLTNPPLRTLDVQRRRLKVGINACGKVNTFISLNLLMILSFDVGIRNLAYCLLDYSEEDASWNILDWNVLDCTATNPTLKVIQELDALPHLLEVNIVLIEKQPSFNPKMRVIGACLYTYFTLRILHEQNKRAKIMYYSAKHKLRDVSISSAAKTKYQRNKKIAVEHVSNLISNTPWSQYFTSCKKKDDLADSLLQGLSYCK
jgi:hypothetical protein